jgi:hypothetical protein
VGIITEELNMNKETVLQIIKDNFGMRKNSQEWCLESLQMTRNKVGFTFHLIFYTLQRCLIGPLPVMKHDVFNKARKNSEHAVENTEFHLGRKKHTYLARG